MCCFDLFWAFARNDHLTSCMMCSVCTILILNTYQGLITVLKIRSGRSALLEINIHFSLCICWAFPPSKHSHAQWLLQYAFQQVSGQTVIPFKGCAHSQQRTPAPRARIFDLVSSSTPNINSGDIPTARAVPRKVSGTPEPLKPWIGRDRK